MNSLIIAESVLAGVLSFTDNSNHHLVVILQVYRSIKNYLMVGIDKPCFILLSSMYLHNIIIIRYYTIIAHSFIE